MPWAGSANTCGKYASVGARARGRDQDGRRASHCHGRGRRAFANRNAHTDLKVELHQRLLDVINLQALDKMSRQQIEAEVGDIVYEELSKQNQALNNQERKALVSDVLDELLGLGPIEPLLKDPTITDILINGYRRCSSSATASSNQQTSASRTSATLLRIIQKIVSAVGRRIDDPPCWLDARLADGSRVNAIIAPLAIDGASMSIRKFARSDRHGSPHRDRERPGAGRGGSQGGCEGAPQCPNFGRHRLWQDDHAERDVGIRRQSRTYRDDRGFRRASTPARACRPAGNAAANIEGKGEIGQRFWSRTPCVCARIASSSARCAPVKPSTCSRL